MRTLQRHPNSPRSACRTQPLVLQSREVSTSDHRRELSPGILELTRAAVIAIAITLLPQGVWSALIVTNLRHVPSIPWSVLIMALVLIGGFQYLRGAWGPSRSAALRRRSLRATVVSREILGWAWLAGGISMIALGGAWIILALLTLMAGGVLPDLSTFSKLMVVPAVSMGALISPLCEQAGIWGYWQECAERRWTGPIAIVLTALFFALGPHPPAGAPFVPKTLFFFLTGLTFSAMAYFTQSIVPAIPVHAVGLLTFFLAVWPHDPERRLVLTNGTDLWFWIHVGQTAVCGAIAYWAFGRLAAVQARRAPSADSPISNS